MFDLVKLQKTRTRAFEKYQIAMKSLENPEFPDVAAQEANDAWLEFKKADKALSNGSTYKKLGELYGC